MLYLQVYIDDMRYLINSRCILTVVPIVERSAIDQAPECFIGQMNYHLQFIPIIDLRVLFHGQLSSKRLSTRIVIVEDSAFPSYRLGLLGEKVFDTVDLDGNMLCVENSKDSPFLENIRLHKKLIQEIRVDKIFQDYQEVIKICQNGH